MFASVTDMAGIDTPDSVQMGSLLPGMDGAVVGQPVLAERFEEEMLAARFAPGTANGEGTEVNPHGRFRTFRSGPWKLVQHSTDGTFLYNLEDDPGENIDLAEKNYQEVDRLTAELELLQSSLGLPDLDAAIDAPRGVPEMDAETRKHLVELGYLEEEDPAGGE